MPRQRRKRRNEETHEDVHSMFAVRVLVAALLQLVAQVQYCKGRHIESALVSPRAALVPCTHIWSLRAGGTKASVRAVTKGQARARTTAQSTARRWASNELASRWLSHIAAVKRQRGQRARRRREHLRRRALSAQIHGLADRPPVRGRSGRASRRLLTGSCDSCASPVRRPRCQR